MTGGGFHQWLVSSTAVDGFRSAESLPWWLGLCAVGLWLAARQHRRALSWSGIFEAQTAGARPLEISPLVGLALRGAALVCLALVLAEPVGRRELSPEPGLGLDIVLVLDASSSMRALDTEADGQARTRLDLAKRVVARFAEHRVASGDRVGLVVFGERAFTQCPLTSDGGLLQAALQRVKVGVAGDSTALGDALALAVKRGIGSSEASVGGRVAVLLTDGRSNAGAVPVSIASELASGAAMRVHTVGIGTGGEEVPMAARGVGDQGLRFERHDPDPATLEAIAADTGGRFFAVRRSSDLADVYSEIDSLERVARTLPARVRESPRSEPLLAAAGGLLIFEIALTRLLRRRLP